MREFRDINIEGKYFRIFSCSYLMEPLGGNAALHVVSSVSMAENQFKEGKL